MSASSSLLHYTLISLFCSSYSFFFFFYSYGDHRDLHSFPTRRSSDLTMQLGGLGLMLLGMGPLLLPAAFHQIRSEEHTSELQSRPHLVCRLLLEKKKKKKH